MSLSLFISSQFFDITSRNIHNFTAAFYVYYYVY